MQRLVLVAIVATMATAKPGLYKEKEDFQYSRSSTDEGSKSGFYGAQRGNMGGNYERSHNMDGLAQNQMSGLVRQVEGELGDGSKTKTGSVYTAANSRGVYGSGHYDLSNLQGRNFQEGVSFDDSQSQSESQSLTAHSGYNAHSSGYNAHSSGYNAHSSDYNAHSSGYNAQSAALNSAAYGTGNSHGSRSRTGYDGNKYYGQNTAKSNLQQTESQLQAANQYDYGGQEANGYFSQSAYNGQSAYDQSSSTLQHANSYGSNAQTRLRSTMPVKVVLRPGTRVAVPVSAQTYDSSNSDAYNHNSINSDTELISNQNHQGNNYYKPTGAKHYESSYSYRKEWEKHDTQTVTALPIAAPTENPFPKNSELYEDAQSQLASQKYESSGAASQRSQSQSSNSYGGYSANANSALTRQSHHQSTYNAQHRGSTSAAATDSSHSSQGTFNSGVGIDNANTIEDVHSRPKSYHSSYSYHKSWERQGDPYVIKPASTGYDTQSSERLTAASTNQGAWSSHGYGSRYQQAHQNVLNLEDCDEHGHRRVARSYGTSQYEEQNTQQQHPYSYDQAQYSQQSQNLEDLTQQTQKKWDKIEDLGQLAQNKWDKIEDLGQQSQNKWDQSEDLRQQSQNKWDQLEDLGQQSQNKWEQSQDLGQQAQNKWDQSEDLTQQSQDKWDQSQDLGQQAQNKWEQSQDLGQQTQTQWDKLEDGGQQTQNQWDKLEDIGQQTQTHSDNTKFGQQSSQTWDHFDGQQSQLEDGQQLQNTWSQLESSSHHDMGHETQSKWDSLNIPPQDVISGNMKPTNTPTRRPLETASHNLPVLINDQNEENKKPLNPNIEPGEYNIFILQGSNFPQEQPVQSSTIKNENIPNRPQNTLINNPFNSMNKYWDQSNTGSLPTIVHNNFNNPWINGLPSSEQAENGNYYNQYSYMNNGWNSQWGAFPGSHPQNAWDVSSINNYHTTEIIPTNTAQGTPTLLNLWNKVETIEKQTISSNKNNTEESKRINTKPISGQINVNDHSIYPSLRNVETSTSKMSTTRNSTTSTAINSNPQESLLAPSDVGRGDIGPEDFGSVSRPPKINPEMFNEFGIQTKPNGFITTLEQKQYKTPVEIEALSQINDKTFTSSTEGIGTVNLHEPINTLPEENTTAHAINELSQNTINSINLDQYGGNSVTVINEKSNGINQLPNSTQHFEQENKQFEQENVYQQFTPLETASHKYNGTISTPLREQNEKDKTHINKIERKEIGIVSVQSNTVNNIRTDQNLGPENMNTPDKNNKDQDNSYKPTDKKSNLFHQLPHNPQDGDQQLSINNEKFTIYNDQELRNGQEINRFDQQNADQVNENFGQQSENFGQQSENFGQQSENFGQFENFGQQSENFGQFENFGQQSENFGQESENFAHQGQDFGQQFENVGQQSENFGQESVNFGQQSGNYGQLNENFEQSVNIGQQSENLDQNTDQQFETLDTFYTQDAGQKLLDLSTQKEKKYTAAEVIHYNPINSAQQQKEQQININNATPVEQVQNPGQNIGGNLLEQQSDQGKDLRQQVQTGWEHYQDVPETSNVQETQNLQVLPIEKPVNKINVPEDRAIKVKDNKETDNNDLKSTSESTPPEPENKPGFWKSVGNKLVNAKDKVFSWFQW